MTKIKLNWQYAKGELETGTLKMLCIPARGKRIFGEDEMDAELCIKDQWNLSIAKIHLGDVESSNILCEEIARRWNEFEEWHECKENTNDVPKRNTPCLLRVEYKEIATGIVEIGYLTSVWNEYGWTEDYLDNFDTEYMCSYVRNHQTGMKWGRLINIKRKKTCNRKEIQ